MMVKMVVVVVLEVVVCMVLHIVQGFSILCMVLFRAAFCQLDKLLNEYYVVIVEVVKAIMAT